MRDAPNAVTAGPAKNKVHVQICGEEYVIKGEARPEYMARLAGTVDAKLRELAGLHRHLPLHRVAILAAIHIADELERARSENDQLRGKVREAR